MKYNSIMMRNFRIFKYRSQWVKRIIKINKNKKTIRKKRNKR